MRCGNKCFPLGSQVRVGLLRHIHTGKRERAQVERKRIKMGIRSSLKKKCNSGQKKGIGDGNGRV